jgi:thiol-disulfide isomerase/thioredoxin
MKRLMSLGFVALLAACGQGEAPKADAARSQGGTPAKTASFDTQFAGTPAPGVPLETGPDGKTETIADIVKANPGKPVLVNLWATWCAPCLKELPTLDALAAATKGRLVVVPISQDMEGWQKVSPTFTAAKYPNLSTRLESQMQFGFQLKAKGLPLTIFYGPDGREIWRYAGDRDWNAPEARARLGV